MSVILKRHKTKSRFGGDEGGIAATEFALLMPVLLLLYLGGFELTRIISANEKLTLFTRALGDLSGRSDNASPSVDTMTTIASAATAIMRPFDTTGLQIVVSSMGVNSSNSTFVGGVCSSWAQNAAARPARQINGNDGLPVTPEVYRTDGARYMLAEVAMPYNPVVGASIFRQVFGSNGLRFTRQIPWAQRTNTEIILPGGSSCPKFK
ncbi:TadE/TadG family type IV pilus assembly protein [Methylobacterium adhaesivum]|jgi:Flp pilus assembly protein TadG|uniref:TadE/TadG family type IV pilus assembly protein n=1 Tax=Methylobacterium adhaesivum TaxID=333297 RepID=A0ABT8BNJ9_9HYPH|nr:TadE/TadG family type IV pilus assembly protein [Methylobacterium adhaesivum]MDN3593120.1 TadE/TadG family type IV pilus assembly protein [Methylobacterium adhaesivum]